MRMLTVWTLREVSTVSVEMDTLEVVLSVLVSVQCAAIHTSTSFVCVWLICTLVNNNVFKIHILHSRC